MKTYIKFLIYTYLRSFIYVSLIILSLVFIINLLSELEFFKELNVSIAFIIYLSFLNSPSMIFEIFPCFFNKYSAIFVKYLQIMKYKFLNIQV